MAETSIQWTDHSINPIRARLLESGTIGHYCEKIAPGCKNCYASNLQKRFQMPAFGGGQLRDKVGIFLDESKLDEVRRRKKPTKYFWCDMSDLFGDWVKPEWVAKCFATMDATPQHTHQLLTKRPENIRKMWPLYWDLIGGHRQPATSDESNLLGTKLHRANVWLGTSISDQETANKAIPELLRCRELASVLFLSAEPLLGPVDLSRVGNHDGTCANRFDGNCLYVGDIGGAEYAWSPRNFIQWVIVGGESGPHARPCNPKWIRSLVEQCKAASVPCFVKQLGGNIVLRNDEVEDQFNNSDTGWPDPHVEYDIHGFRENFQGADCRVCLQDKKGGNPDEWPADLRVREFPIVNAL